MKRKVILTVLIILLSTSHFVCAEITVIAGSSSVSPPPFWDDSYGAIGGGMERAFPFTIDSDGPYKVEKLEVAVFHSMGVEGSQAWFSINLNDNGHPGQSVTTFDITGIGTTPQIMTADNAQEIILSADTSYWLVGGALQGYVNWNLADNVFGTTGFRMGGGQWDISSNNVSAFSILGSPVPEPATMMLLGLGGLMLRKKKA